MSKFFVCQSKNIYQPQKRGYLPGQVSPPPSPFCVLFFLGLEELMTKSHGDVPWVTTQSAPVPAQPLLV